MRRLRILPVAIAVAAALPVRAERPKVLATGWDLGDVTPSEYLAHADLFERLPIDGVTFNLAGTNAAGEKLWYRTIMSDPRWERAAFDGDVPILKELVARRPFRESLMNAFRLAGPRIPWTDDAAWARFASNMGVLAAVARDAGVKGILIDMEDYPKNGQFRLKPEDGEGEAASSLVRRRAREVFEAVFAEHPSATVLSYFFLCGCGEYLAAPDPRKAALDAGNLMPSFVDGILDALPPGATLVDGVEAYRKEAARNDYAVSYMTVKKAAVLVSPENRAKYHAQMKVGFGMFVDMYWREKSPKFNWYMGPVNGSRLEHFRLNFEQAISVADGYVWLYMPRSSVVKWRDIAARRYIRRNTIEENLPGFADTVSAVRDPESYAMARLGKLKSEGRLDDRLAGTKAGTWQREFKGREPGRMDADTLEASAVKEGSFTFDVGGVKPGELYALKVDVKGTGWNVAYRFRQTDPDADFEWTGRKTFTCGRFAFVRVPQGVDRMQILLRLAQGASDSARFSHPVLYRLD